MPQLFPTRNREVLNIVIFKFTQWVRNQQINPNKDSPVLEQMLDQDSKLSRISHSSQSFRFAYHTDLFLMNLPFFWETAEVNKEERK